ncbi:DNA/RNA non-specific endonuclease [Agrobacterium rubi]|nr:DNA/RNA non-specific endonuclease [Agrobacterium rubi]NTF24004.1 DNA/RNA non-specific endonuclease [Agrobacterium rubi]
MRKSLLLLALIASPVQAAQSSCPQFFVGASAPDITRQSMVTRTGELCYSDFSIMHSGITAGPLWVAERLTSDGIRAAKKVPRVDQFFADPGVAAADRAELDHYRKSGYDRGHMAPSADMTSEKSQAESFTLANMVPQLPDLNRKLWADIESTTRGLALSYGEVYVITGPAFIGDRLKRIGGRVLVPSATFKAVYVPSQRAAGAWWAENSGDGQKFELVSITELGRRIGVDVFPSLPQDVKTAAARLPPPKAGSDASAGGRPQASRAVPVHAPATAAPGWGDLFGRMATDVLERMMK